MRILLQIPDGLKRQAVEIAKKLEENGDEVFIHCEPCYGACDLRDKEAFELKCDKIIHYGHAEMVESAIPVEYVEMKQEVDADKIKTILEGNELPKVGIVSALQFEDWLIEAEKYVDGIIGGKILGCDVSCAKEIEDEVEGFLFVGTGEFHAIGLAMQTEKPVWIMDLENEEIRRIDKTKFEKQKFVALGLLKQAKRVGILVSTKHGQNCLEIVDEIKEKLKDKECFVLVMDEIKPEKLIGMNVDCFVNTACPRIGIDNRTDFGKPIVNWNEI